MEGVWRGRKVADGSCHFCHLLNGKNGNLMANGRHYFEFSWKATNNWRLGSDAEKFGT
jgi:hypothetical protein